MSEFIIALQPYTRVVHIALGTVGLLLFWVPMLTRKGGRRHRQFGRIFEKIGWGVIAFAAFGVIAGFTRFYANEIGFADRPGEFAQGLILGNLTITATCMLYQGRVALKVRSDAIKARTAIFFAVHGVLLTSSAALLLFAIILRPPNHILSIVVALLGFAVTWDAYAFVKSRLFTKQAWVSLHLNGMIGTGAAFYVAFGVFGARSIFDTGHISSRSLDVVPWVLPIIVFVPLIKFWQKRAMKMYATPQAEKS